MSIAGRTSTATQQTTKDAPTMANVTLTDKLTAAFATLRVYSFTNIHVLDALPDIGWLSWEELADKIVEALKGQAELLRDEAETIRAETIRATELLRDEAETIRATKLAKAALIDEILG